VGLFGDSSIHTFGDVVHEASRKITGMIMDILYIDIKGK
jgi:hypothetical protein